MPNLRAVAPIVFCILAAIALWFRAQERHRSDWSAPTPTPVSVPARDGGTPLRDAGAVAPALAAPTWSFDLTMTGSSQSPVGVMRKNPFGGPDIDAHELVLGAAELQAAHAFLQRRGATDDGPDGHRVALADGSRLRFTEERADAGTGSRWHVQFDRTLQDLTPPALAFLFELAAEGMFVIDGNDVAIVTSEAAEKQMPSSELVASPEELGVLLKLGLGDWKRRYRHD